MSPEPSVSAPPARGDVLVQVFSSLGHGFMHLLSAYYYVVALRLEREWGRPYADLLGLWTFGAAMVGLMAVPAGWLADRWSTRGMMAVFFVGLGTSALLCGMAGGPGGLRAALALLGAFAAIYHPVGIPWLVRHARQRGRALGFNGIFGSLGVALGGVTAGALSDLVGWRLAFAIPGALSIVAGFILTWCIVAGVVPEAPPARPAAAAATGRGSIRVFWILVFTMFSGSLIYQVTQAALPKSLAMTLHSTLGDRTAAIGALVGAVYAIASLTQVIAGHLADRYPLRVVYVIALLAQAPVMWAMTWIGGWAFAGTAVLAVAIGTGAIPAENMLLMESTPPARQGLAFGLRFVLTFGAAPFGLWIVAAVGRATGEFTLAFLGCAGLAILAGLAALQLRPRERASAG